MHSATSPDFLDRGHDANPIITLGDVFAAMERDNNTVAEMREEEKEALRKGMKGADDVERERQEKAKEMRKAEAAAEKAASKQGAAGDAGAGNAPKKSTNSHRVRKTPDGGKVIGEDGTERVACPACGRTFKNYIGVGVHWTYCEVAGNRRG